MNRKERQLVLHIMAMIRLR